MEDIKKYSGYEWIKTIGIAIVLAVFFRTFFFSSYVVDGESMLPTLEDGNLLIVNKIGYEIGELKRFDVIVFHATSEDDFVKRIIGLPGDKIEYKNDVLYINGQAYEEEYLKQYKSGMIEQRLTEDFTLFDLTGIETVPEGHIFVLGDNRKGSFDSRQFGFVPMEKIVGKVNLRYWPMDEINIKF
ncbi:signal peptidase I [Calidifontibacillus oryziterrae]|uniref:signal peptidase I n=1 Tax=Calidifontibacillus oryziterrae TaxID=1191699 RepID=UPI000304A696|nr:signal peptidase I [Calidifontibacillus oryziterrae]